MPFIIDHLYRHASLRRMHLSVLLLILLLLLSLPVLAQDFQPNAQVKAMSTLLNLRAAPDSAAAVLAELPGKTPLLVSGRTADNAWYQAQDAAGTTGWVFAAYVELQVPLDSLPILTPDSVPVTGAAPEATPIPAGPPAGGDATVRAVSLNLRASPSTRAAVLTMLPNQTPLTLIGRTADNAWLKVQTSDGLEGWVSAAYLTVRISLSPLPVENPAVAAGGNSAPAVTTCAGSSALSNVVNNAQVIYRTGQQSGKRAYVFAKVGDSITVSTEMYDPIGRGYYNLGGYGCLQGIIDVFGGSDFNSFVHVSLAAGRGWTTASVLDPAYAHPSDCLAGEIPLICEYRRIQPAVALIMLGSNDVHFLDATTYTDNLKTIVRLTIDSGIIPVVSTIPNRTGYEAQVSRFNEIIWQMAVSNGIPLWDYYGVMSGLPNSGLSGDGLHPSSSPRGYEGAADFNGDNLQFGYVMRNLTMLQVLDGLWSQVLSR